MKLKFLYFVITVLFVNSYAFAQKPVQTSDKTVQEKSDVFRSPFRYVLVAGTNLENYVNRFPSDFQKIEVLIDDKAFNENNLKILSELLSKRFSSAKVLSVDIYTSLEAIKTPEENDHSNLKGPVDNYFNYKRAEFVRNTFGNEWFEYSIPNLVDGKIIVLKGCYIKCK